MAKTVANQKIVKICKAKTDKGNIYGILNKDCSMRAMRELKHNELKVYLYLVLNQDNYDLALSTKDISEKTKANQRKIQEAINGLIEKGYLKQIEDGSNIYIFYEDNAMHKKDMANLSDVPKGHTPMYNLDIAPCTKSTPPLSKKDIEILQDITYNNTNNNTTEESLFQYEEGEYEWIDFKGERRLVRKNPLTGNLDLISREEESKYEG